jgi:DNA-binding NtrC family response regulator
MKVHAIRAGQTATVWELEEGQGSRDIGSSPKAHWYLPNCPDFLCRVEVAGDKLVVTELGEAAIAVNGVPAGFRVELANGVCSACAVGDWALVVTLDPPSPERNLAAEIAAAKAASTAAPTAGSPDVIPPVRDIALKIHDGRRVAIIEATAGLTFGRDETNGYPLDHDFVSRFHARLEDGVKGIYLRDLGSLHHTWVGLKCLDANERELLEVGAVVRFTDAFAAPRMEVLAREHVARERAKLDPDGSLTGESPQFLATLDRAMQYAGGSGKSPIVFIAESGTGKSALARLVGGRCRPGGPFVTVDCGAIPANLIESELFGHVKGAFTGAEKRKGLLQKADGGVILIDEIGDLPLELQPRLLRFLNDGVIRPVGSEIEIPVDVRIIAATHRNLKELVEAGLFREDLFNRLGKLIVRLLALREHKSDIPLIAANHLAAHPKDGVQLVLTDEAAAALLHYDWPGNVRELLSVIQAAALLTRSRYLEAATIEAVMRDADEAFQRPAPAARQAGPEAEPAERAIVVEALRRLKGEPYTQAQAAGLAVERAIVEEAIRRSGGKGSDSLWAALGYENKATLQRRRQKWGI